MVSALQLQLAPGTPVHPLLTALTRLLSSDPVTVIPRGPTLPVLTARDLDAAASRLDLSGAAVVASSGSSGTPKRVVLSAAALSAGADATAARLGGHGSWVLALPSWHIAGFQVLARAVRAGTVPIDLTGHSFTPTRFAQAVRSLPADHPRYTALVPTQITRLLEERVGQAALRDLDAVLVGGGALPGSTLARARDLGAPLVTTYGMTETAGGCVYDGRPLDGVEVRADQSGRLSIAGPVLARGYLSLAGTPESGSVASPESGSVASPEPGGASRAALDRSPDAGDDFHVDPDGRRWYRTSDLGEVKTQTDPVSGGDRVRVRVHGRADDVVITGGHKVNPTDVDHALLRLPEVHAASVHGLPDPEWGCVVAAVVATRRWPEGPADPTLLRVVRERLRPLLPAWALPRQVLVVPALPMLDSGKPDRQRLERLLRGEVAE